MDPQTARVLDDLAFRLDVVLKVAIAALDAAAQTAHAAGTPLDVERLAQSIDMPPPMGMPAAAADRERRVRLAASEYVRAWGDAVRLHSKP